MGNTMLFDAHTHLNFEKYTEEERRGLAAEIEASDVGYIIDVADCVGSAVQALRDADDYPWCYAAVGIHPDHASTYTDADIEEIRKLAAHPKAVAIGEIGLDFYYGTDDREEQQELFRKQIRLANELRMPIMIHSRDAHQLTMDILKEEGAFSDDRKSWFPKRPGPLKEDGTRDMLPDARVLMHCFSYSAETAAEYVKLGGTISICGPVTFKSNKKTRRVVEQIPIEFLTVETDAPYLAPEPMRGHPNKSVYVEYTCRKVAEIKGISYEEAAEITKRNAMRFYGVNGDGSF